MGFVGLRRPALRARPDRARARQAVRRPWALRCSPTGWPPRRRSSSHPRRAPTCRSRCGGTACRSRRRPPDAVVPGRPLPGSKAKDARLGQWVTGNGRDACASQGADGGGRQRTDQGPGYERARRRGRSSTGTWPGNRARTRWRRRGTLRSAGLLVTLDYLGEDTTDAQRAAATAAQYVHLLGKLAAEGLTEGGAVEVSVKPTAVGLLLGSEGPVRARAASANGSRPSTLSGSPPPRGTPERP